MSLFIISFGPNAMDHLADEVMPDVARAAHAVVQEIVDAGAYVLSGGLDGWTRVVATDGTVNSDAEPGSLGGVTVIDVSSREEALMWAARIAVACRCAQEVQELGRDPELDAMLSRATD